MLLLSEYAETRFNCCADAWPQFTCDFMIISFGSDRHPSIASPRAPPFKLEMYAGVQTDTGHPAV